MLHHRNIFELMRHYTQWDNKLPSASVISISYIVMVCYWSHWMMQDFLIHTKLYRICKTEGWRWSLLIDVCHWLHKVFSNRDGSWSAYHRQNHLDRSSVHKYWVNKLASRSRYCNCWDIAEREKRNTIWPFDTQNREIFSATCHFEKEKKNICPTCYTVKTKSKGKKNVVVLSTSRPLHGKTINDGKEKPK